MTTARSREFHAATGHLWARLGLGAASPDEAGKLGLRIDSFSLSFSESPDRRNLLVRGEAGKLSTDRTTASRQVHQILRSGLGFLLTSRAGIRLGAEAGEGKVVLEAACPYSACSPEIVISLMEDVLHRLEFHRMQLAAPKPRAAKEEDSAVIVRL